MHRKKRFRRWLVALIAAALIAGAQITGIQFAGTLRGWAQEGGDPLEGAGGQPVERLEEPVGEEDPVENVPDEAGLPVEDPGEAGDEEFNWEPSLKPEGEPDNEIAGVQELPNEAEPQPPQEGVAFGYQHLPEDPIYHELELVPAPDPPAEEAAVEPAANDELVLQPDADEFQLEVQGPQQSEAGPEAGPPAENIEDGANDIAGQPTAEQLAAIAPDASGEETLGSSLQSGSAGQLSSQLSTSHAQGHSDAVQLLRGQRSAP